MERNKRAPAGRAARPGQMENTSQLSRIPGRLSSQIPNLFFCRIDAVIEQARGGGSKC